MPIQALSPTRVDLAGGTLDIAPLTQILKVKKTVNFGISLYASVTVRSSSGGFVLKSIDQGVSLKGNWLEIGSQGKLPLLERILHHFWHPELPPLEIEVQAMSPAGAGLGGSSCLGIAMASALLAARAASGMPWPLDEKQLVQHVQDLETSVIRVPTGCQDYWGGLRGGVNIISYPPGGVEVETLREGRADQLQRMLILCYSGVSRASGTNNWAIFKKAFDGDRETLGILEQIGEISEELAQCVRGESWSEVFRLSQKEWQLRTRLWSDIETAETKRISLSAEKAGAHLVRICGAGGGGVMAVFAPQELHAKVRKALEEAGGRILDGNVCYASTQVKGHL